MVMPSLAPPVAFPARLLVSFVGGADCTQKEEMKDTLGLGHGLCPGEKSQPAFGGLPAVGAQCALPRARLPP